MITPKIAPIVFYVLAVLSGMLVTQAQTQFQLQLGIIQTQPYDDLHIAIELRCKQLGQICFFSLENGPVTWQIINKAYLVIPKNKAGEFGLYFFSLRIQKPSGDFVRQQLIIQVNQGILSLHTKQKFEAVERGSGQFKIEDQDYILLLRENLYQNLTEIGEILRKGDYLQISLKLQQIIKFSAACPVKKVFLNNLVKVIDEQRAQNKVEAHIKLGQLRFYQPKLLELIHVRQNLEISQLKKQRQTLINQLSALRQIKQSSSNKYAEIKSHLSEFSQQILEKIISSEFDAMENKQGNQQLAESQANLMSLLKEKKQLEKMRSQEKLRLAVQNQFNQQYLDLEYLSNGIKKYSQRAIQSENIYKTSKSRVHKIYQPLQLRQKELDTLILQIQAKQNQRISLIQYYHNRQNLQLILLEKLSEIYEEVTDLNCS